MISKESVVWGFAIVGIAGDGVTDVFHVQSDLVSSSGSGLYFQQAVARRRVAINGVGQFDSCDGFVASDCVSRFFVFCIAVANRMIYLTACCAVATHNCQIHLLYRALVKLE